MKKIKKLEADGKCLVERGNVFGLDMMRKRIALNQVTVLVVNKHNSVDLGGTD